MTQLAGNSGIFVREDDAAALDFPNINLTRLIAEGADTNGAFSAIRSTMLPGANGASPHHHARASELFFVIDGAVDILAGTDVVTAQRGDLAVITPGAMHAFANASATEAADLLIIFGPGIERFGYFQLLHGVVSGTTPIADVLASQELCDNWFADSPAWTAHRSRNTPS